MKLAMYIVVFLALTGEGVSGQELWNGATAGMSLSAIKSQFPDGIEKFETSENNDGEDALYALPGVEIMDETYQARFYFRDDALTFVRLSAISLPEKETARNQAKTRQITSALEDKYSSDAECKDGPTDSQGIYVGVSCELNTKTGLNISVTYMEVLDVPARYIGYRFLGTPSSENL